MARVPKITSPCPLRWAGPPQPGMDFCGQCQRRVHNLDLMSDAEREAFLKSCTGDICVSYTVKRTARIPVALGLSLAAIAGVPTNAANEKAPDVVVIADSKYCLSQEYFMTAGATRPEKPEWIDESEVALPEKPDLPDITASTWLPTPKS